MAWDTEPPKPEELTGGSWDSTPPTPTELGSGDYWGDVKKNAIAGVKQWPDAGAAIGGQALKIGRAMLPGQMMQSGIEAMQGKPVMETPAGEGAKALYDVGKGGLQGVWQGVKDTGSVVKAPFEMMGGEDLAQTDIGQKFRERPLSVPAGVVGTVLPAARLGRMGLSSVGEGLNAFGPTENIVPTIERIANNQTLKSMGGSIGQLGQMAKGSEGRAGLDMAAQYAREKGLADVTSTSIGRDNLLAALKKSSGETAGTLRKEAGNAPTGIPEKIGASLEEKYGKGGLQSSETRNVKKALTDVKRMSGESAAPDLPVVQPGAKTGDPHAVFSYNDKAGPGGVDRSIYTIFGDPESPVFKTKAPSGAGGYGSSMTKADVDALGVPITGREPRSVGKWEPLDLSKPPTHAGLAEAATYLNDQAAGGKMYQPQTATTDVANMLSDENNQGIVQTLGSDKGKQYLGALEEQKRLHPLEHLQQRGELRDVGGRGGQGLGRAFIQKIADSAGYRLSAKGAALMHELLAKEGNLMPGVTPLAGAPIAAGMGDYLQKKYGKK